MNYVNKNLDIKRFRGVAVITSALHAEGRRFDPGRNHQSLLFFYIFTLQLKNTFEIIKYEKVNEK